MATGTITNVIPTSGNNTYGSYVKFPDGVMLCWGSATNTSTGSLTVTFPIEFNVAPTIFATARYVSGAINFYPVTQNNAKATFALYFRDAYSNAAYTNTSAKCFWLAIGRWK